MRNKKGFTLIELLAVIVILAILVMLAIPAVTRYLTTARKNAFSDNALRAVEAVRNDVVTGGFSTTSPTREAGYCTGTKCYYNLTDINKLLETKLLTSPFGNSYEGDNAAVCIVVDQANNTYTMTMVDNGKNGFFDKIAGTNETETQGSGDNQTTVTKGIDATIVANTADVTVPDNAIANAQCGRTSTQTNNP